MPAANPFSSFVPGFDFLQNLVKGSSSALPTMGQWVAPTLDPEEIDRRIGELRTVQFWLEQNAQMLSGTIQALEVQRMTLATLQQMNVPLSDIGEALKAKAPLNPFAPAPAAAKAEPAPAAPTAEPTPGKTEAENAPAAAHPIDPTKWWGALTQQFTEIAQHAIKATTPQAAQDLAQQVVQQSVEAGQAVAKAAAPLMASVAPRAEKTAKTKPTTGGGAKAAAAPRATARKATAKASAPRAPAKRASNKR